MKYYKLKIIETASNSLKDHVENSRIFNTIIEFFTTKEDVNEYLINRYNKDITKGKRRAIYLNTEDNKSIPVGIIYSFWNKDISHNSKSWYQTDWIELKKIEERVENLVKGR